MWDGKFCVETQSDVVEEEGVARSHEDGPRRPLVGCDWVQQWKCRGAVQTFGEAKKESNVSGWCVAFVSGCNNGYVERREKNQMYVYTGGSGRVVFDIPKTIYCIKKT